jgi:hypothetical protein
LKKEPVELNENSVNKCKDSLDSFDKDLIRRVVVGFLSEGLGGVHCWDAVWWVSTQVSSK